MSDLEFVPLLSGKPLSQFEPKEFRDYIKGLYFKPEPKKGASKAKPFTFSVNKKGTLILRTTKRDPKFLTEEEMLRVSEETGKPLSEVFLKMKEKGWERREEDTKNPNS